MSSKDEDNTLKAALYAFGTMTQMEVRAFEEDAETFDEASRAEMQEFDEVVELLAFAMPEAVPSAAVREKLNALMATEPRLPSAQPQRQAAAPGNLVTIRRDEGKWLQAYQGVHVKTVFADPHKGSTSYLVRFEPGANIPLHRHPQVEECVVIEGDFCVDGKVLGPGDYHCAMAGSIHDRPHTMNGALVMIVASEPYEHLEQ